MLKNTSLNRKVLRKIALALGELNTEVVYVGGAVVSLYINDPAADDVRPTKDVDISLSIASLHKLETIRQDLIIKGFTQSAEEDIICRFRYEDIMVDVMNTKHLGWAPANPWFKDGYKKKQQRDIEGQVIFIMPLEFYLASKLTAFMNRGSLDPRTSHDFEDVVYILDNRIDIVEQVNTSSSEVKSFLQQQFRQILNDRRKLEAVMGNLAYESKEERYKGVVEKLKMLS